MTYLSNTSHTSTDYVYVNLHSRSLRPLRYLFIVSISCLLFSNNALPLSRIGENVSPVKFLWPGILIYDLDLQAWQSVKLNQLSRRSFRSKLFVQTNRHTYPTEYIYLDHEVIGNYRASYVLRGICHGRVSVCACLSVCPCLSVYVTSRTSTKMAKHRNTQITPHGTIAQGL